MPKKGNSGLRPGHGASRQHPSPAKIGCAWMNGRSRRSLRFLSGLSHRGLTGPRRQARQTPLTPFMTGPDLLKPRQTLGRLLFLSLSRHTLGKTSLAQGNLPLAHATPSLAHGTTPAELGTTPAHSYALWFLFVLPPAFQPLSLIFLGHFPRGSCFQAGPGG